MSTNEVEPTQIEMMTEGELTNHRNEIVAELVDNDNAVHEMTSRSRVLINILEDIDEEVAKRYAT